MMVRPELGKFRFDSHYQKKSSNTQFHSKKALELGPRNIRVNAVNPTVVLTAMGEIGWSDPKKAGPMLAQIPVSSPFHLQKLCLIALLTLFLLSVASWADLPNREKSPSVLLTSCPTGRA
jgi:NAD(P)-dependent dehydrogenase (short-subunit alcohol dehydrogenase family)